MFGDGKPSQLNATQGGATAGAARPAGVQARGGQGSGRLVANRAPADLPQEYRYVTHDLRRLGTLAVGIFAVLVTLGFIVR